MPFPKIPRQLQEEIVFPKELQRFRYEEVTILNFIQGRGHRVGPGGTMAPPRFCVAKRKKGNKGKKERVSKQKLLKGCH